MNKFLFTGNNFLPRLIKMENYSSPHDLCLESTQYKNPSKECYQSIDYAINQTIIICSTLICYERMFKKCDWTKRFDKCS